ncbi:MAG: hypothetical protein ABJ387_14615 [Balneola sp.]|uniref:hypothetical protein n=1 Tax=Balneola sp. EhC07 TaxID=1849360 RepID=UPI0007F3C93C|nr:hypothetical protein [Balneola sp. EhC07]OAN60791.1 hypothetical protein A8B79_09750 [Balneola sp. EhC07]
MEFQGLQNTIPVFVTVIVALLICFLSWFSYKKYSTISLAWKLSLSSLRAISLIVLLFLFLNPFFKTIEEIIVNPKIAVLLDGSESTSIQKGDYNGEESYQNVIANLRDAPNNTDLVFFNFGETIQSVDPDEFSVTYPLTNIFNAVETITTADEDFSSVILISDGIITSGKNPVLIARNSSIPIHTIAIGDTTKVKDISIQNISTNGTGFTNTMHQVLVDISQFGFDNRSVTVNLKSDDRVLDSKSLSLSKDKEIYELQFEMELTEPGLKQFRIEINSGLEEWSSENNTAFFSIDVLDSKKRILHIASAVHPDVKALRSILMSDENIELSTYTSLGPISGLKNLNESGEYDLIIYHGKPSENVFSELGLKNKETSTLFILLPDRESIISSEAFNIIGNDSPNIFNVQMEVSSQGSDHPILDLVESNLNTFAPVQSSINAYNEYPEASLLLTSRYQNISTNSPLLSTLEQGNIRKSDLNASGWYKLYLSPNSNERAFITQLIINLVDWTSSNPDNRLLKIKPLKNAFNSGESSMINASLINETGDIESNAVIEFTLNSDDYAANYTMDNLGNGNYQLQIPNLMEGNYKFSATARKGNREIDTETGEFLVSQSSIELANTVRNDEMLNNISTGSGGSFFDFGSANEFWETSEIVSNLQSRTEIKESYIYPVRYVFWFVLVLTLLGTEWLIRKKFALP